MTNVSTAVSITDFLTPAVREMPPSGIRRFLNIVQAEKISYRLVSVNRIL